MRLLASALLLAAALAAPADSLRSQIEASDKPIVAAMKKKDFATLGKLLRSAVTPDFAYVETGQGGKPQTFDQMMANMKAGLTSMGKLTTVEAKVLSAKETGKTGTSTSRHLIVAMVPGPDKKMHPMTMAGLSTESYVKVGSKWKMSKMVWKNGAMTMDGKPMDPSKMGG